MLGEIAARHGAYLVIPPAEPEDVVEPLLGEQRVGRGRCHHEDARLGVDFGCGARGARTHVADDHIDAVGDELVGGSDSLLGVAVVVDHDRLDLLAEHAARLVQLGDCHFGAPFQFLAAPRQRPGHRRRHADQDCGLGTQRRDECGGECDNEWRKKTLHGLVPPRTPAAMILDS
jgi:hypothetical protein